MIINENKSNYFRVDTTGMDKYDKIINNPKLYKDKVNLTYKIRWMTPVEYIARCARDIFNVEFDRLFDDRDGHKKVKKYCKMMKNGVQFDMPIINYAEHQQEGLHRSIAALRLSEEDLIPVMIIYNNAPLSKFKPSN